MTRQRQRRPSRDGVGVRDFGGSATRAYRRRGTVFNRQDALSVSRVLAVRAGAAALSTGGSQSIHLHSCLASLVLLADVLEAELGPLLRGVGIRLVLLLGLVRGRVHAGGKLDVCGAERGAGRFGSGRCRVARSEGETAEASSGLEGAGKVRGWRAARTVLGERIRAPLVVDDVQKRTRRHDGSVRAAHVDRALAFEISTRCRGSRAPLTRGKNVQLLT